ncbi:hypothetical protein LCGC14_3118340 [marine sediment metagenome]|uniref:Uncharacterized protein n=2 Tax=root TaxID=1 RepID=A0A831QLK2_9FLAO|nr:hypothetical protein [Pricia antarctica]
MEKRIVYYRFGKKFYKVKRNEIIKKGAMHAFCEGELKPIRGFGTVGNTPSNFSDERDFYNPLIQEA